MMKAVLFLGLLAAAAQGYNYKGAIKASLLFYEAQRSGRVSNNRIRWTKNNFLNDGRDVGKNLAGGYFDGTSWAAHEASLPKCNTIFLCSWRLCQIQLPHGFHSDCPLLGWN